MITTLVCSLALLLSKRQDQLWPRVDLPKKPNSVANLYFQVNPEPMEPPRLSPKRFGEDKIQWEFPWIVAGDARLNGDAPARDLKFRIYSQEQKASKAPQVARMLLRLWELNVERFHLGHNPNYHNGLVDVFLCFGGKAGGEQRFDEEIAPDPIHPGKTNIYKANTIYIYDMASFTDPVEMAREVAHEYGHATWPFVGGFTEPEEWADGYLAEKVYLRWIRDEIAKGILTPDDAMGATVAGLDKWLADNADPLILKGAQTLPTTEILSDKSAKGMNAFIGLALYIETIFPDKMFIRSLGLAGSYDAKDYPSGVLLAADELDEVTLKIPDKYFGKAVWIPVGKGKVTGGRILKFDPSGWAQVEVRNNSIVLTNTR